VRHTVSGKARHLMLVAIVVAVTFLLGGPGHAQSGQLPDGPITLVVPLAAGGPTDALARIVAEKLATRLDRTIVVENKGGAGGNIGAAAVAKARPDGSTWLFAIDSLITINPYLYRSQGFDPKADLAPVSIVGEFSLTLAVNAAVPAGSWRELVEYSRSKSLNFGSAGFGTPPHLAFEYLKWVSKLDAVHVAFRGAAPALTELLAGNVDASFLVSGAVIDHVKAGKLRALAVSAPNRLAFLPDVPTASEAGIPDFEARFANLLWMPAKTPGSVQQLVSKEIAAIVKLPDVRARFGTLATDPVGSSPEEAAERIAQESARWGKVIQAANIKLP
jgi:tripartite-type tricarboxylate transporter receptor subunit TctC